MTQKFPMTQKFRGNILIPIVMLVGISLAGTGMAFLLYSLRSPTETDWASTRAVETAFVGKLVSRMTWEEKIGQCNLAVPTVDLNAPRVSLEEDPLQALEIFRLSEAQREDLHHGRISGFIGAAGPDFVRAVEIEVLESRLAIPVLFGAELPHGYATIFPSPLAEASSWDPTLAQRTARAAATEATAVGINWNLAPDVNLGRDARWGGIVEGAGEDTLLASQFAAARVRGFQGQSLGEPDTLAATAKHFIAHGAGVGGLPYAAIELPEYVVRQFYLPPFQAAVNAGVAVVMAAVNDINGIPGTVHTKYLHDVLRRELSFAGFVLSHWRVDREVHTQGIASEESDAVKRAFNAGIDMGLGSASCHDVLQALHEQGQLDGARLNEATRRILSVKYRLGLFDNSLLYADNERMQKSLRSKQTQQLAREAARQSIVLLKNEGELLPLALGDSAQTIALIGPFIKDEDNLSATWLPPHRHSPGVSLYAGIVAARGGNEKDLRYAQGSGIDQALAGGIAEAVRAAKRADVVLLALGEATPRAGEPASRTYIGLPKAQLELAQAVIATGVPVAVLLRNGRPLAVPWLAQNATALVETWFLGSQTGHAVADILFARHAPSGRLPISIPRQSGQEPLYYNNKNTGPLPPARPAADGIQVGALSHHYQDALATALFPFGHGLSYTKFRYQSLELDHWLVPPRGALRVTVTLRNIGERDGTEVVQLYLRDRVASMTQPVRQLVAYRRQFLKAGETRRIGFTLKTDQLSFIGPNNKAITEPGRFDLMVGKDSTQGLQAHFYVISRVGSVAADKALPLTVSWDPAANGFEQALSVATATGKHDTQDLLGIYYEAGSRDSNTTLDSTQTLFVNVTDIDAASGGILWLRLFANQRGWDNGEAVATQQLELSGVAAQTSFPNLLPGSYALRVLQDLDGDGLTRLDKFDLPLEPISFSNRAQYTLHGAPEFEMARFEITQRASSVSIAMP